MLVAVGLLLRRSAVVVVLALAVAALIAVVLPGDFTDRFGLVAFFTGGVLLLFAGTGTSPAMDRAVGQDTRTMVGRLMGRPDETFRGPVPSASGVLLVAALIVFAVAVVVTL
jgi:hypothetical protein